VEDGVEAAGVVAGVITSSIVCDASSGSAAALRGCLTSLVGAAGAVAAAALDLGRDLTCGCLSSLEDGVEAAGVVGRDLTSFLGAAGAVAAAASDLGRDLTSLLSH
jgi:hypothetical protein